MTPFNFQQRLKGGPKITKVCWEMTVEAIWIQRFHCCVQKTVLDDLTFWLEGAFRRWVHCSSYVAHLFQGTMWYALREGVLGTLAVTSGYLCFSCLSIISKQSGCCPLTSTINVVFLPWEQLLTGWFLFSHQILAVIPCCVWICQ